MRIKQNKNEPLIPAEDESIIQRSSCSLLAVLSVLAIIFLVFLFLLLRMRSMDTKTITDIQTNTPAISSTDQSALDTKVPGEAISLRITAEKLDSAVKALKDFPLKKPSVKIDSSKILLSGKTSNSIFGLSVDVSIVPKVSDGKISYDITEIKASGVAAPKAISDQINQNLASSLSGILPVDSSVNISEIKLSDGYLDIIGQKK